MNAVTIVTSLLEDEDDPKDFLHRHNDIGYESFFTRKGWVYLGHGDHGTTVFHRKHAEIAYNVWVSRSNGTLSAVFGGKKLVPYMDNTGQITTQWVDFDIEGEIYLKPGESPSEWVDNIDEFLSDETGPNTDDYYPFNHD